MSQDPITKKEIRELQRNDCKLVLSFSLLESMLFGIDDKIKLRAGEDGKFVKDPSDGETPDLFTLLEYYRDNFSDFSALSRSRQVRNRIVHRNPGVSYPMSNEIEVAVNSVFLAIEELEKNNQSQTSDNSLQLIIALVIAGGFFAIFIIRQIILFVVENKWFFIIGAILISAVLLYFYNKKTNQQDELNE